MSYKKWLSVSILASASLCSAAIADDRGVNTAVGAVVGALIGNSVNGHNGAVVGGVLGAVVGASASSGNYGGGYYDQGGYASGPGYGNYYQPAQQVYYQPTQVYAPPATVYYQSNSYRSAPNYYGPRQVGYGGGRDYSRRDRDYDGHRGGRGDRGDRGDHDRR